MSGCSYGDGLNGRVLGRLSPALSLLLQAYEYSEDTASGAWDFAVEIRVLQEMAVTDSDLRWLAKKGYVLHAREVTVEGDDGREFRPTGDLSFSERTCFVLTQSGLDLVRSWQGVGPSNGTQLPSRNANSTEPCEPNESTKPSWNADARKLHFGGVLVKRFKWPAMNQEAVLCAFEEEDWPEKIDDPLPPQPEQDSRRRLADTIKCLNRKQINKLLHFRGDGTGEGVLWERVDELRTIDES